MILEKEAGEQKRILTSGIIGMNLERATPFHLGQSRDDSHSTPCPVQVVTNLASFHI